MLLGMHKLQHYAQIMQNSHKNGENMVKMPDVKRDYIFFNTNLEWQVRYFWVRYWKKLFMYIFSRTLHHMKHSAVSNDHTLISK